MRETRIRHDLDNRGLVIFNGLFEESDLYYSKTWQELQDLAQQFYSACQTSGIYFTEITLRPAD